MASQVALPFVFDAACSVSVFLRSPLRYHHGLLQVIVHPVLGIRDSLIWDRL